MDRLWLEGEFDGGAVGDTTPYIRARLFAVCNEDAAETATASPAMAGEERHLAATSHVKFIHLRSRECGVAQP